jgi:hypothetical protein
VATGVGLGVAGAKVGTGVAGAVVAGDGEAWARPPPVRGVRGGGVTSGVIGAGVAVSAAGVGAKVGKARVGEGIRVGSGVVRVISPVCRDEIS